MHLRMVGINVRDVLGHKNVETTMVYIHVIREIGNTITEPIGCVVGYSA